MIVFLNGKIAEKQPNKVIVDVNGVGYEAGISTQTFASLPPTGTTFFLHIYHHITDSEQRLFGFLNREEKSLFELLITVKGIGPRLALTILSGMSARDIAASIAHQDAAMLARTPGIGKKTAERLVLELRDKVSVGADGNAAKSGSSPASGPSAEATSALESLGFKRQDAENAVSKVLKTENGLETGELVRKALQLLYK